MKMLVNSCEHWNLSKSTLPPGRSESQAEDVPHQRTVPVGQLKWFHFTDARYFTRNMEMTNITDLLRIHARNYERQDSAVRDKNKSKPVVDTRGSTEKWNTWIFPFCKFYIFNDKITILICTFCRTNTNSDPCSLRQIKDEELGSC